MIDITRLKIKINKIFSSLLLSLATFTVLSKMGVLEAGEGFEASLLLTAMASFEDFT